MNTINKMDVRGSILHLQNIEDYIFSNQMDDQGRSELLQQLCKKKKRSAIENKLIMRLTQEYDYFMKINAKKVNIDNEVHKKICQYLQGKSVSKGIQQYSSLYNNQIGRHIFQQGDYPDYFYILLKGQCIIFQHHDPEHIYSNQNQNHYFKQSPQLEVSLQDLAAYQNKSKITIRSFLIIRYFVNIIKKIILSNLYVKYSKDSSKKDSSIDSQSQNSLKKKSNSVILQKQNPLIVRIFHQIEKVFNGEMNRVKLSEINYNFRLFNQNGVNQQMQFQLKNVQVVQEGHSFGELGFVNKTFRSGSVIASEECFFGCLDQIGYESSVIEADKKRIKNHTNFLRQVLLPNSQIKQQNLISKLTFYFEKQQQFMANHLFTQKDLFDNIYVIRKGEIELYQQHHKQEFKIQILGPYTFANEGCYFDNAKYNIHSAKIISLKCTFFVIKKVNFDRIVQENKEIYNHLHSQWTIKKQYYQERYNIFLSLRSSELILPQKMILQKHGKGSNDFRFNKLKLDDLTVSPSMPQLKIEKIVNSNSQRRQNKDQIDIRQLFLLTKSVGNFQLALRNYKSGKVMSDNDEIKVRNLVNHRMGKTHRFNLSDQQSFNTVEQSIVKDRCYNLIRSMSTKNNINSQDIDKSSQNYKNQFIHSSDFQKIKAERNKLKFKGFKVQVNKFKSHIKKNDIDFYSQDYSSKLL